MLIDYEFLGRTDDGAKYWVEEKEDGKEDYNWAVEYTQLKLTLSNHELVFKLLDEEYFCNNYCPIN